MTCFRKTSCRILVAALFTLSILPAANAETLGDVLRETGWNRMLGTWVHTDANGNEIKVSYRWRFKDHVVEIKSAMGDNQTMALMGRNPNSGEIYYVSADNVGGSAIGKWSQEGDEAILDIAYVSGQGAEGSLRIRHKLTQKNTLIVTLEKETPLTIKMVRAPRGKKTEKPVDSKKE